MFHQQHDPFKNKVQTPQKILFSVTNASGFDDKDTMKNLSLTQKVHRKTAINKLLSDGGRQVLGKMAIQWSRLQQRHYQQLEHQRTGTWWASRVAKALLAHYRSCWNQRKKALKKEECPGDQCGAIELDRMIYEQLTEGVADLPREHRHHFCFPLPWMLSRDVAWKWTWLNNILAASACQVRRLQGNDDPLRQQCRQMYNWLFTILTDNIVLLSRSKPTLTPYIVDLFCDETEEVLNVFVGDVSWLTSPVPIDCDRVSLLYSQSLGSCTYPEGTANEATMGVFVV